MNLIEYTVFDRLTGEVRNSGARQTDHLPQANSKHEVLLGVRVNPNTQRINPATLQPEALAVSRREAHRANLPPAEPDERDVIIEALKADLTPAKLAAARQRLKAAKALHTP